MLHWAERCRVPGLGCAGARLPACSPLRSALAAASRLPCSWPLLRPAQKPYELVAGAAAVDKGAARHWRRRRAATGQRAFEGLQVLVAPRAGQALQVGGHHVRAGGERAASSSSAVGDVCVWDACLQRTQFAAVPPRLQQRDQGRAAAACCPPAAGSRSRRAAAAGGDVDLVVCGSGAAPHGAQRWRRWWARGRRRLRRCMWWSGLPSPRPRWPSMWCSVGARAGRGEAAHVGAVLRPRGSMPGPCLASRLLFRAPHCLPMQQAGTGAGRRAGCARQAPGGGGSGWRRWRQR